MCEIISQKAIGDRDLRMAQLVERIPENSLKKTWTNISSLMTSLFPQALFHCGDKKGYQKDLYGWKLALTSNKSHTHLCFYVLCVVFRLPEYCVGACNLLSLKHSFLSPQGLALVTGMCLHVCTTLCLFRNNKQTNIGYDLLLRYSLSPSKVRFT